MRRTAVIVVLVMAVVAAGRSQAGGRRSLFGPQPEGELRRIALDIDLAKSELAWHPWTHLEDGLKETVAFLRGI